MEKKYMERLVGKYCKIVTKEPGEERASVVTGTLEDVDYKDGFVLVDSEQVVINFALFATNLKRNFSIGIFENLVW